MIQPLKWHGGKHYLAKRIVELMPPHLHYVEPYFGGGAVLFARDPEKDWYEGATDYDGSAKMRGCSEVVNDIDGELMNFWFVLKHENYFDTFKRCLEATPFSQEGWQRACGTEAGIVRRAIAFFVRYRQSRQGLGEDFATLSRNRTRRGMNEQVSSWLSAVEGLPEAHERLKRVVILCDDAVKVIHQQDGPKTFFYCDPPCPHDTRVTTGDYQHEMTRQNHVELLVSLSRARGKFLLSGYRNALYDAHAQRFGWHRIDIPIDCKASGKKKKPKRVESLWMNYAATPAGKLC